MPPKPLDPKKLKKKPPFIQLDLFGPQSHQVSQTQVPEPAIDLPTAPPEKIVTPPIIWTCDKTLQLLSPIAAELVQLNLGLKSRRRHSPQEIAGLLSKNLQWVNHTLHTSYAALASKLQSSALDPKDLDLAKIRAHLFPNTQA